MKTIIIDILAKYYHFLIILLFIFSSIGCRKFLEIEMPKNQILADQVFANDENAVSAVRGIYASMMSSGSGSFVGGGTESLSLLLGRSSDEFFNYSSNSLIVEFSQNSISPGNGVSHNSLWGEAYKNIYYVNSLLKNLEDSKLVSNSVRQRLIGEAKFIRAFIYFYLVNLYGNVPLILTTDYRINRFEKAASPIRIYDQCVQDLLEAKMLLTEIYPTGERIHANKASATAMLARLYLYLKDWSNAEIQSSEVISNENYKIVTDLNQAFLKNSKETILQFVLPEEHGLNTREGKTFIMSAIPSGTTEVVLSSELLAAFEPGDNRETNWVKEFKSGNISWFHPFKYKIETGISPRNEYTMVLRLAEQYLIRAEARINSNKIDLGISDLNIIRTRSRAQPTLSIPNPLPNLSGTLSKVDALLAVEHERRIELFSEWGHRWLDLKRTGRADLSLSSLKAPYWQPSDVLYPIPTPELLNNPNLEQNDGYE